MKVLCSKLNMKFKHTILLISLGQAFLIFLVFLLSGYFNTFFLRRDLSISGTGWF